MRRINCSKIAINKGYSYKSTNKLGFVSVSELMLYDLFIIQKLNLTFISRLINVSITSISIEIRKYKWYFNRELKNRCQECGGLITDDNKIHCKRCVKILSKRYNIQMMI